MPSYSKVPSLKGKGWVVGKTALIWPGNLNCQYIFKIGIIGNQKRLKNEWDTITGKVKI